MLEKIKVVFKKENIIKICIYAVILVSLLPILKIANYNHPSADDYGYSDTIYKTVQNGGNFFDVIKEAFKATISGMQVWQGLYSSGFVLALQPAVFGENFYSLVTYIMILAIVLGIGVLFKRISKYIFKSNSRAWIISTILVSFFIIQTLPSPIEGLFWFNGAVNYTFFMMVLCYEVSLLIKYYNMEKKKIWPIIILIWTSIISFIMSGGNHVTAFLSMLVIFLAVVYAIYKKQYKIAIAYVVALLCGIFGFYINMTSPGTLIRSSAINNHGGVIETIIKSAYQGITYINNWTSLSLILILAALTPYIYKMVKDKEFYKKVKWQGIFISILLSYGAICAMLCVPYYAMGSFGAGRLTDVVYITFSLLSVLNYTYFICILLKYVDMSNIINSISKINTAISCALFMVALVIVSIAGNGTQPTTSNEALKELISGEAMLYDEQMDNRIKYYLDESITNVEIDPVTVHPKLLYFEDLSTDANDWKNVEASIYYNKETIKVKADN